MQISYYGLSCFRVASKPGGRATEDVVVFFDPINEKGVRAVYGKTDVVLCSQGKEACSMDSGKGDVTVFDFPGEYSIRGVNIIGIDASSEKGMNTFFIFESEDIRIAHLGRLRGNVTEKQLESFAEADILLVPVGGGEFIGEKTACEIIRKVEPKVVIPMMYNLPGIPYELENIQKFFGEMGLDGVKPVDKFVCKKKDLEEKRSEIVLLTSQR